MEQTSSANEHFHISRVKEWGYHLNNGQMIPYAKLWDCTECGVESSDPFRDESDIFVDHSKCDWDPCFGCKARSIQMNAGDAKSAIINGGMTQKAWDKELDEYKKARAQGIQPKTTRMKDIRQAVEISNTVGKAYDAGSPTGGIL